MWPMLIPVLGQVLDKIFPDQDKANEAKARLIELQMSGDLQKIAGQLEINKEEAKSTSLFVAGWRPAIGWVCTLALFYQFIVRPMVAWGFAIYGRELPPMPGLDEMLWELLFGMLGLGSLRTLEKVKGVA
jgi:hypothetical protein